MSASLTAVARHFLFVRETEGPNQGYWVNYFQRFTGNVEGESWCASFVAKVNDIATKGKMTVTRTASTALMLSDARAKKRVVIHPQVNDLYFIVRDDGSPHHVGIVAAINPLVGIAGNTSKDGASSNGDGVYEHVIGVAPNSLVYVRLPA